MQASKFFWLHIKKSAGLSTRKHLQPYYKEVDRTKRPANFIQSDPSEYNDILNNYRVVLGDYQFRRCLFAKEFLYKEDWKNVFSFAFSREPVDRCLSMFFYTFWTDLGFTGNFIRSLKKSIRNRKLAYTVSYAFDAFLDKVEETRASDSIYDPLGLHFSTHTAAMWEDVTDREGNILLRKIFRLENMIQGINEVYEGCGIEKRLGSEEVQLNKNNSRHIFTPSKLQLKKIESLYSGDFEIYESAAS